MPELCGSKDESCAGGTHQAWRERVFEDLLDLRVQKLRGQPKEDEVRSCERAGRSVQKGKEAGGSLLR